MPYRAGDIARWTLALALPLAGGVLATYGELIWGAAAVAVLAAVPAARPYAAGAAAAFGLLVLARAGAAVPARGVTAVLLGLAAIAAIAYVLLLRKRTDRRVADARWAFALGAAAAVVVAGAALLFGSPTLNLVLVPLAALVALASPAGGERLARGAFVALVVGLALGGMKGAAGYALAGRAEAALARGDFAVAERDASYADALAPGARSDLIRLKAAAAGGAPWEKLEVIYSNRDRFTSPRSFDAALAVAALARGEYEKAAMYGDLATTPSPTSPARDEAVPRGELYESFAAAAPAGPYARGWLAMWDGRYDEAAAAFATAPGERARLEQALALERAGKREAAAALYAEMWDANRNDFAAGFGLLRNGGRAGLRGTMWKRMGKVYPRVIVGTALNAEDGFALTKRRLSLGRTPATLRHWGRGRRNVAVIAESYGADGLYPIVELSVNGKIVHTFYMDVAGENIYETSIELDGEKNTVGLLFVNDYADPEREVDRNVYVREVRLSGNRSKR